MDPMDFQSVSDSLHPIFFAIPPAALETLSRHMRRTGPPQKRAQLQLVSADELGTTLSEKNEN
jgi:hypothetical protein